MGNIVSDDSAVKTITVNSFSGTGPISNYYLNAGPIPGSASTGSGYLSITNGQTTTITNSATGTTSTNFTLGVITASGSITSINLYGNMNNSSAWSTGSSMQLAVNGTSISSQFLYIAGQSGATGYTGALNATGVGYFNTSWTFPTPIPVIAGQTIGLIGVQLPIFNFSTITAVVTLQNSVAMSLSQTKTSVINNQNISTTGGTIAIATIIDTGIITSVNLSGIMTASSALASGSSMQLIIGSSTQSSWFYVGGGGGSFNSNWGSASSPLNISVTAGQTIYLSGVQLTGMGFSSMVVTINTIIPGSTTANNQYIQVPSNINALNGNFSSISSGSATISGPATINNGGLLINQTSAGSTGAAGNNGLVIQGTSKWTLGEITGPVTKTNRLCFSVNNIPFACINPTTGNLTSSTDPTW